MNFIVNSCVDVIIQRKVHERDVHPHFVVEISEQVIIADETVLLFYEKPWGIGTTIKQVSFWVGMLSSRRSEGRTECLSESHPD